MSAHFTWNYFSYGLLAAPLFPLLLPQRLPGEVLLPLHPPYLCTVAVTTIVGPTADKLEKGGMSRTNVRKLSQTLCFGGRRRGPHRGRLRGQLHPS